MEERFKKANELLTEEPFLAKLKEAQSHEDVCALFAENGVNLSVEDVQKMCEESVYLQKKDELSEEELNSVNGGIVISATTAVCFLLASASLGFYGAYGYRTVKDWLKRRK